MTNHDKVLGRNQAVRKMLEYDTEIDRRPGARSLLLGGWAKTNSEEVHVPSRWEDELLMALILEIASIPRIAAPVGGTFIDNTWNRMEGYDS